MVAIFLYKVPHWGTNCPVSVVSNFIMQKENINFIRNCKIWAFYFKVSDPIIWGKSHTSKRFNSEVNAVGLRNAVWILLHPALVAWESLLLHLLLCATHWWFQWNPVLWLPKELPYIPALSISVFSDQGLWNKVQGGEKHNNQAVFIQQGTLRV